MDTPEPNRKYFAWGCSVSIDPVTKHPTEILVDHCAGCKCPGPDEDGIRMIILERACELHESNVVKYMVPVVNIMAKSAATKLGLNLHQGIDDLPEYEDKVRWVDGVCVEILGRGFTDEEFQELDKLPPGQLMCTWLL